MDNIEITEKDLPIDVVLKAFEMAKNKEQNENEFPITDDILKETKIDPEEGLKNNNPMIIKEFIGKEVETVIDPYFTRRTQRIEGGEVKVIKEEIIKLENENM